MSFATAKAEQPLGEINTTPLIDVLLVLLVMMVLTIPMATNSLPFDLPDGKETTARPEPVRNTLVVTEGGQLLWNDRAVDAGQLATLLGQVRSMSPEPEVQFRPQPDASYDSTAQVLKIVKASQISRFGFVDNEKYREFTR